MVRYVRVGRKTQVVLRGRATAGVAARFPAPRRPGRYRVTLRVTAIPYRADAAVLGGPLVRVRG